MEFLSVIIKNADLSFKKLYVVTYKAWGNKPTTKRHLINNLNFPNFEWMNDRKLYGFLTVLLSLEQSLESSRYHKCSLEQNFIFQSKNHSVLGMSSHFYIQLGKLSPSSIRTNICFKKTSKFFKLGSFFFLKKKRSSFHSPILWSFLR